MNRSQVYMCPPHPKPPLPLFLPTLSLWVVPEHRLLCALFHESNLHWSSILHMALYMFQCCSLEMVFFKCVLESFDALTSSGNAVAPRQGKILNRFCSFPLPLGTRFLLLAPSSHMVSEAPDSFPRTLVANRLFRWWWAAGVRALRQLITETLPSTPGFPGGSFFSSLLLWRLQILPSGSLLCLRLVIVQSLSHVRLCDSLGCSTPGIPVLHYLLEFAQIHVHWVSDTNHLIFCHSLLLLPSIFPSIRVLTQLFASDGRSIGPYSV